MKTCKYCGKSFSRNGVLFHQYNCKQNPMNIVEEKSLSKPMEKPMEKPMDRLQENEKPMDRIADSENKKKPMDRLLEKPMKPMDDDPEYTLTHYPETETHYEHWTCSKCQIDLDCPEKRCPICGARFA